MTGKRMTRRKFLARASAIAGLAALAAACGPTPTPKIVEKVVEKVVTQVVERVVKETVVKEVKVPVIVEKITLRVQVRGGDGGLFQREFGEKFAKANPNITVKFEDTVYGEIAQKTEMAAATGTLQDVLYGHTRWYRMGCYKGFHFQLDELLKAGLIADYDDFYPVAVENEKWEGKTYCILTYTMAGGNILLTWNRPLIKQFGAKAPEPGFTMEELKEAALRCTDQKKGIFGIQFDGISTHIYTENITRAWGKPSYGPKGDTSGWTMQPDWKTFTWYKHPGPEWFYNKIYRPLLDARAHPLAADLVEAGLFPSQRLAFNTTIDSGNVAHRLKIGDKWDYHSEDVILLPVGPDGRQGTNHSANMLMVGGTSKYPEEALRLIGAMTSTEAGIWDTLNTGYPAKGRKSVFTDKKMQDYNPALKVLDELQSKMGAEPYPMPWNLRGYELTDIFNNNTAHLFQGTKSWEEQAPIVQAECQKLLDQPRP